MSAPAAFQDWLGLLFGIVCLLGLPVLFWLALRRPPVRRPSCGSCGYAVEGLEALSCPECGSDLREVGIVTPRRRMLHPGLFVLFWSLLLIIPFTTAFTIAMRAGPRMIVADATFGLAAISGAMPQLHVDQRIEAIAVGRGVSVTSAAGSTSTADGVTTTSFRFPAIGGATVRPRTVDVRTAVDAVRSVAPSLTLESGDGGPETIDTATLSVVFDKPTADFPEDAAEAAALLDALVKGDPAFTTTRLVIAGNNTMTSVSRIAGWYAPVLVALGAAIYGLGILVYLVLRRKRLASGRD